jgi:hypothetical protein
MLTNINIQFKWTMKNTLSQDESNKKDPFEGKGR